MFPPSSRVRPDVVDPGEHWRPAGSPGADQ